MRNDKHGCLLYWLEKRQTTRSWIERPPCPIEGCAGGASDVTCRQSSFEFSLFRNAFPTLLRFEGDVKIKTLPIISMNIFPVKFFMYALHNMQRKMVSVRM